MSVRRTVAALLGAALLLAGCSDDPEPRFQPTDSPSPSESATSAEPEAQTPEEFIREWFSVGTDMQNTGETEAFLALSSNCQPCDAFAEEVADVYATGGYIRIKSERVVDVRRLGSGAFIVTVKASPTEFRESANAKLDSFPGGLNEYQVDLAPTGDGWLISDYLDRT